MTTLKIFVRKHFSVLMNTMYALFLVAAIVCTKMEAYVLFGVLSVAVIAGSAFLFLIDIKGHKIARESNARKPGTVTAS